MHPLDRFCTPLIDFAPPKGSFAPPKCKMHPLGEILSKYAVFHMK